MGRKTGAAAEREGRGAGGAIVGEEVDGLGTGRREEGEVRWEVGGGWQESWETGWTSAEAERAELRRKEEEVGEGCGWEEESELGGGRRAEEGERGTRVQSREESGTGTMDGRPRHSRLAFNYSQPKRSHDTGCPGVGTK